MICDYSIPKSGRIARLLIEHAGLLNLQLDNSIMALAHDDLITEEMVSTIPASFGVTKETLQPIYDRDFRCLLWSKTISRLINVSLALGTIHEGMTTIVTGHQSSQTHWTNAVEMIGGQGKFEFARSDQLLDHDYVKGRRNNLLIAEVAATGDYMCDSPLINLVPYDFSRVILLEQRLSAPEISDAYVTHISPLFPEASKLLLNWFTRRNFNSSKPQHCENSNDDAFLSASWDSVLRLVNIINI